MSICTYIYIYIHTHTYVHLYIHAHTYIHTYIHTSLHTCTHTYTHTYIDIGTYIHINMYTCFYHTYIKTGKHIRIDTYTQKYMYAHIPIYSICSIYISIYLQNICTRLCMCIDMYDACILWETAWFSAPVTLCNVAVAQVGASDSGDDIVIPLHFSPSLPQCLLSYSWTCHGRALDGLEQTQLETVLKA